ncbi:QRFP-like peptide receptor [Lingula anatina]|uniref:QRFP-like peptide receptor n=1 Tax=Lingula anatina TaxID=7574 RepID=A0A1S3J8J0_LINAN|nr:QRFP-like peptide receptor [Lingula anatina]|eukprot:XP_013406184.1 QRFP-like peptide receptor [Lingula anatina]
MDSAESNYLSNLTILPFPPDLISSILCQRYQNLSEDLLEFLDSLDIQEACNINGTTSGDGHVYEGLPVTSQIILTVLYIVVFLVSLAGNIVVVMVYASNKTLRTVTSVFILSLTGSDLLITFFCIPFNIGMILSKYWVFGGFACRMVPYVQNVSVSCSTLSLCSIAIDRYYSCVQPLKKKHIHTYARALKLMAVVWAVSIVVNIPVLLSYQLLSIPVETAGHQETRSFCIWASDWTINTFNITFIFFLFVIPFTIMTGLYLKIGHFMFVRRPVGTASSTLEDVFTRAKKRAIKMMIIVVLVFTACWAPLMTYTLSDPPLSETSKCIRSYLQWMALGSVCYNPIIYTFLNKRFRKSASGVFLRLCRDRRLKPAPKNLVPRAPVARAQGITATKSSQL